MLRAMLLGLGLPVLAVFLATSAVVAALHWPLARRTGWRPWPLLGAGLSLAGALSVTLTPAVGGSSEIGRCVISLPTSVGLMDLPAVTQESLNALLLLPFGFFASLAVRRVWPVAAAALLLPALIEGVQALVPAIGRLCIVQDWFDNASGGLLGALSGVILTLLWRRVRAHKR